MKSVVIIGSARLKKEVKKFQKDLEELGVEVLDFISVQGKNDDEELVTRGLVFDQFRKIKIADVVYVYNKGGYLGYGSTLELGFAAALNKPIYVYTMNDNETARKILYRSQIKTPKELVEKLK